MGHRVNTRNFENGEDSRAGQSNLKIFLDRHWQFGSKADMMSAFGHDPKALAEIERRFAPRLVGEHVYLTLEDGSKDICIGYIDPQSERGYYIISLNTEFGEDSECISGKHNAIDRLYQIYKSAINETN